MSTDNAIKLWFESETLLLVQLDHKIFLGFGRDLRFLHRRAVLRYLIFQGVLQDFLIDHLNENFQQILLLLTLKNKKKNC